MKEAIMFRFLLYSVWLDIEVLWLMDLIDMFLMLHYRIMIPKQIANDIDDDVLWYFHLRWEDMTNWVKSGEILT